MIVFFLISCQVTNQIWRKENRKAPVISRQMYANTQNIKEYTYVAK